jgi:hypothetical protein
MIDIFSSRGLGGIINLNVPQTQASNNIPAPGK